MTNIAHSVDQAFYFITWVSVALLAIVTFFMVYFAIKYRKDKHPKAEEIEGHLWLEILWTVLPTILVMFMFYMGYTGFVLMRNVPDDAMEVKVTAQMWSWQFQYDSGKVSDILVLPIDEPIKLSLGAKDVLHSLFIPAFRVKEDAVPGVPTYLWFIAEELGEYDLFCAEYCGLGHSGMITKVNILSKAEFDKWNTVKTAAPDALGLLKAKGCLGCHSLDGTRKVGPALNDIADKPGMLADGSAYKADKAYIKRAILKPKAEVVKDYPPIMPTIPLTDEELEIISAFLAGEEKPVAPSGKEVLKTKGCLGCHSLDGTRKIGPPLNGIFGRKGTLADSTAYEADRAYIKRAILEPKAEVVKDYPPIMPTIPLSKAELSGVLDYLKETK
jgi:cytochrome c oxidase subunit 2